MLVVLVAVEIVLAPILVVTETSSANSYLNVYLLLFSPLKYTVLPLPVPSTSLFCFAIISLAIYIGGFHRKMVKIQT